MTINSGLIKEKIMDAGIDLVGVADAQNLILAYPPRSATDLMPTAKSVIVMAVAHSLGAVYSPDIMLWTRSKMQTSRVLDETAEKVGRMLEKQGFLALPVSADKPSEGFKLDPETGKKFRPTRFAGFLSLKHAAVSCSMGEMGKNNLLLTPEFGPHQRLCAIITEADLEPDPRQELDLCKGCSKCMEACPSGALTPEGYDVDPCFMYWAFGFKRLLPARFWQWPGFIWMIRQHLKKRDVLLETYQSAITDVDYCIECMRACPVGENWKKIRPQELPLQKSGGTELENRD
jgi:ferredoxin